MRLNKFCSFITALVLAISAGANDVPDAPPCASYICIEADSGVVVAEHNADEVRAPASMIKLMMMLMVAEGIEAEAWDWSTPIIATRKAQGMGGTQVYLDAGEERTVLELMHACAIASANDATMALAEGLWGSESAYLKAMNQRAEDLGMIDSEFTSVHGLPPDKGEEPDKTTARDMAILAQWIVRRPELVKLTQMQELVFRPGESVKHNTNKLLWRMEDCDGLKTGYIRIAGFCVTATAMRNDVRLISVLMGCDNANERFRFAEHLMDVGFSRIRRATILRAGDTVKADIPLENALDTHVRPVAAEDLAIVLTNEEASAVSYQYRVPEFVRAPLAEGTPVGTVEVRVDGHARGSVPLIVGGAVPEPTWRWKLLSAFPAGQ